MSRYAWAASRIVTCDPRRETPSDPLGVLENGAVVVEDDMVAWVGLRSELDRAIPVTDYGHRVLTPGLVDAHTHAAWTGSRHVEYAMRMAGADYRAIAEAGGGIRATRRSIEAASEESLADELLARLHRMATLGVTSVEVKSGYGLTPEGEWKQLSAIARAARDADAPYVVPTFLALHAIPEESAARRDDYVAHVARSLVPEVARHHLARFVDAYVDEKAFTVAEARLVSEEARSHGLDVRLHVGQFADIGGAELAASVGARSADHLEHVSDAGIARLAAAGVAAGLLPTACLTLKQTPPPVERLRRAGVKLVVASDANPGTAPTESLPLAMALGTILYGLSPAEALVSATRHAAESLGLRDAGANRPRGSLEAGAAADIVVWDLPHEYAIVQPWGASRTHLVARDGRVIHRASA